MARHSSVSIFAFATAAVGLLANIVSVGTTSWLISTKYLKMAIGIFRHCDFDSHYCGGMSEISAIVDGQEVGWFRAVQALFLLSCVANLMATLLIGLVLINFFDNKGTFKVIAVIAFGSALAGTLSALFFGLHYQDIFVITSSEGGYLGYSFYLAVVAVFFVFLSFLASVIEGTQTSKVLQNMQHRITVWSTPYTLFVDQEA